MTGQRPESDLSGWFGHWLQPIGLDQWLETLAISRADGHNYSL